MFMKFIILDSMFWKCKGSVIIKFVIPNNGRETA
jgi:hypothetical protein